MLQNVTVCGKKSHPLDGAGGISPTVGPNVTKCHCGKKPHRWWDRSHRWWDQSHRGTKCYKMSLWEKIPLFMASSAAPADAARLACGRAAPATTANSISWRVRRNSRIRRHQLGAAVLSYHSPASNLPASSISDRNTGPERFPTSPTQRPAYPSAQPARAGVRSESPYPAERTNKKAAGSHGIGGLGDCLPLPHRVDDR